MQVCVEGLEVLHAEQAKMEPNSVMQGIGKCHHILNSHPPPITPSTHHTFHPSHLPPITPSTHHTFHPSHPPPIISPPVICQLQSVCRVVLNFDPSMVVLVWRGMGRLVCRVKMELPEGWSIQPIIAELCSAIEAKCAECVQCAPTAANEVSQLVC